MQWKVEFYNKSVQKNLDVLEKSLKTKLISIINMMFEHGPDLGMPFTKAMGKGLFEIRAKAQTGIARAFFCTVKNRKIIILHVFVKKTEQTPKKELELAKKRLIEVNKHDI